MFSLINRYTNSMFFRNRPRNKPLWHDLSITSAIMSSNLIINKFDSKFKSQSKL